MSGTDAENVLHARGAERADMKKSIGTCILATAIFVAPVAAQLPVQDVIYPREATSGDCIFFDNQPGMRTINIHHNFGFGSATRFRVEADPGVSMVYAGETHHFASTLGNSQTGVQVCYGDCIVPGVEMPLITINYVALGTSSPCASIKIVPHPDAEVVEVMGCDGVPKNVFGGAIYLNPTAYCFYCEDNITRFEGVPEAFSCEPLPTGATTWGAIKALYR
jgi:hypothetical protein